MTMQEFSPTWKSLCHNTIYLLTRVTSNDGESAKRQRLRSPRNADYGSQWAAVTRTAAAVQSNQSRPSIPAAEAPSVETEPRSLQRMRRRPISGPAEGLGDRTHYPAQGLYVAAGNWHEDTEIIY